ncbi:hypothetical protein C8R43DRAFT_1132195 [Mycena crocata]|nr:hypothetical protein C8R43DRAFT_1132195 [Mycena crocata]
MRFEFEFGLKEDEILADFETGTVVIGVRSSMLNKRSVLLRVEGQFNTYFKLEQLSGSTTVNVAVCGCTWDVVYLHDLGLPPTP